MGICERRLNNKNTISPDKIVITDVKHHLNTILSTQFEQLILK